MIFTQYYLDCLSQASYPWRWTEKPHNHSTWKEPMKLDGRVVVVTGAAGGIGRALALRCAAEGARVAATDIQADACKTGMLSSRGVIEAVEDCITRNKLQPYVCDPVMVSKSGSTLLENDAIASPLQTMSGCS